MLTQSFLRFDSFYLHDFHFQWSIVNFSFQDLEPAQEVEFATEEISAVQSLPEVSTRLKKTAV